MLPAATMTDMYYPMSADIYYSVSSQTALGEISKSWSFDRTIKCSAIKDRPDSTIPPQFQAPRFIEYDLKVRFRTNDNILISTDGFSYHVNDILITNIQDPAGTLVWMEGVDKPTNFELSNVEPMYDPFHKFFGYRILLIRSNDQSDIYVR